MPSSAAITLDQYVTRIEESPIELHGGKKRALTDAEKLLIVQQDELRRLRENGEARKPAPLPPPPPPAPLSSTPTLPSFTALTPAPAQERLQASESSSQISSGSDAANGMASAGNLLGIVAAGVLGGLLYQSNKSAKKTKQDFEGQLAGRDKVPPIVLCIVLIIQSAAKC
jgi:hypothetical protein